VAASSPPRRPLRHCVQSSSDARTEVAELAGVDELLRPGAPTASPVADLLPPAESRRPHRRIEDPPSRIKPPTPDRGPAPQWPLLLLGLHVVDLLTRWLLQLRVGLGRGNAEMEGAGEGRATQRQRLVGPIVGPTG
jgi:hypothetical protein